jgi:hypothetical protein
MDGERVCIGVEIDGTEAIAIYTQLRSIVPDIEKLDGLLQSL